MALALACDREIEAPKVMLKFITEFFPPTIGNLSIKISAFNNPLHQCHNIFLILEYSTVAHLHEKKTSSAYSSSLKILLGQLILPGIIQSLALSHLKWILALHSPVLPYKCCPTNADSLCGCIQSCFPLLLASMNYKFQAYQENFRCFGDTENWPLI